MVSRQQANAFIAGVLLLAAACGSDTPTAPSGAARPTVVAVGRDQPFANIQSALDAVAESGIVTVGPGTYAERIVVRKQVTLLGDGAVIDGLAGGLDGVGVGVWILASGVVVSGFTIQNWERGLVLDHVTKCRVDHNEVRRNHAKAPPPITAGVTQSDGIVLEQAQDNEILSNYIHDNGTLGLYLRNGSSSNKVRANRLIDNGWQQESSGRFGAGILSQVANNDDNEIADNEIAGNDWGLRNSGADNRTVIRNNRIHGNRRAGLFILAPFNRIEGNIVTGNGLANLPPSCRFDMINAFGAGGNTWVDNVGTYDALPPFAQPVCR
jgi:parallel beta-helix repeat protein